MHAHNEFYQLWICKSLDDYFRDTIWYSRLYPTEVACLHGCINSEITDIANVLLFYKIDVTMRPVSNDKFCQNIDDTCRSDNSDHVQFVDRIKEWLRGEEGTYYMEESLLDDNLVFWEVRSFKVASE